MEGQDLDSQEKYLRETPLIWDLKNSIVLRGIKKLVTELTSMKTLFITAIFVGIFCGKIGDLVGLVMGLLALGVKEIPAEVFTGLLTGLIQKFTGKG